MSTYTLPFAAEECNKNQVDLVGGKCASLGELLNAGVKVPPGFAVTTDFYDVFLDRTGLDTDIEQRLDGDLSETQAVRAASEGVRQRIREENFPAELETALESAWDSLLAETAKDAADLSVAVRSSATAEDLPDASFAGQQDTYLGVRSLSSVKKRVRDCIASLFTARAISYREERGFDHRDVKISVGVQRMVDARTSGVMFTLNPANGDRSKVRIEANWGLGEAVVGGQVTPDSFLVDKPVYKIVDREIPEKQVMTVMTNEGVVETKPDPEKRDVPSLSADEIIALTDRAKTIEDYFGKPQDIEWAIEEDDDDKRYYILQSRPETTWNNSSELGSDDSPTNTTDSPAGTILRNVSDSN
ncbi:PEP/pyruvate-binding domain-containing protein [Halobellus sp. GM3]|uniref:PEP/pyruvate-binding domain-containing protein n=1 Tax=Halobellus sp. GM3 TaxID=3458410 RepID=UPI00403DA9B1